MTGIGGTPSKLEIRPFEEGRDLELCARMMSESEPWISLGRGYDASRTILSDAAKERYVGEDANGVVGFLILSMTGALGGYIQTVCVAPDRRGSGIGTRLMAFAEEKMFRESPNVFLCVSLFNSGAQRLYRRLGYEVVGELANFIVPGHSELLMRKSIGPLRDFRRPR